MKVAIITPYYQEAPTLLGRCIRSVNAQTVAADHFMVADGHPQNWIDATSLRHVRLDRSHGDAGNAARAVGALLAIAERYDAIGLLDADNWLEPDHVETCLMAAAAGSPCDYVVAMRTLRRPDESVMPLIDSWPFDTNCLFFLPSAFPVLPLWAMIPERLAMMGDRAFHDMLKRQSLIFVQTDHPTINYHNLWAASYRALGEPLPPGAKESVRVGAS